MTLHLTGIYSKKKRKDMSSESIENILYYQDCNHKQKSKPPPPQPMRRPVQQPECKMCCTMCCGDQCVDSHQLQLGRQAPLSEIEPKGVMPIRPDSVPPRERRKKLKVPLPLRQHLPGRRGLVPLDFTRENIKSLISQDEDIRKILKDLVRVTMQKVDLMQLLNSNKPAAASARPPPEDSASDNDL